MSSNKPFDFSFFLFHRDLRLNDNLGLINALESSNTVVPLFIFDPRQIEVNEYRSKNALSFMLNSIQELNSTLNHRGGHLCTYFGKPTEILRFLFENFEPDGFFVNRDYTPFARDRDQNLKSLCNRYNCNFLQYADYLLQEPEAIEKNAGGPYSIFTPFYKKAKQRTVANPQTLPNPNFYTDSLPKEDKISEIKPLQFNKNPMLKLQGGRQEALKILNHLNQFQNYKDDRDFPVKDATTHLSAHLKFGTISIREAYYAIKDILGENHELIRQLYWRDFFTHIAFHFPKVFGHAFREKYNHLEWNKDIGWFNKWKHGLTGFPIVDAGMRELNKTGYMHNRVRMIVASFLTKDLHINWQWGEKYFAQHLIDYDPSVNNGNWQWAASTGCDAQPYFRIFNPWSQQKKYDPNASYIKEWIPELRDLSPDKIHKWKNAYTDYPEISYPEPIVNHQDERNITLLMFKNVKKKEKE